MFRGTDPAPGRVLCFGSIGVDNLLTVSRIPDSDEGVHADSDRYCLGGGAANAAVHLAAWGVRVTLAGNVLGTDPYGQMAWDRLARFDLLDLQLVSRVPDVSTPFCRVLVTPDGEHRIIARGFGQAPRVAVPEVALGKADWLLLDAYAGPARVDIARRARCLGTRVAAVQVVRLDDPLLSLSDLIVNRIPPKWRGNLARQTADLQAVSGGLVVTTSGARSVFYAAGEGGSEQCEPQADCVRDTLGAGDVFVAGCIYGSLQRWPVKRRVEFALAASALCVERWGGSSPTEVAAVLEQMESSGDSRV